MNTSLTRVERDGDRYSIEVERKGRRARYRISVLRAPIATVRAEDDFWSDFETDPLLAADVLDLVLRIDAGEVIGLPAALGAQAEGA